MKKVMMRKISYNLSIALSLSIAQPILTKTIDRIEYKLSRLSADLSTDFEIIADLIASTCDQNNMVADYIVVGAGTAGAVLLNRLTENGLNSAIGIEAGDNNTFDPRITNPAYFLTLYQNFKPEFFSQGETIPQPQVGNETFAWNQGRTLGGTSMVNVAQYVWGTTNLWNQWETLTGSTGEWTPTVVFNRLKNLETWAGTPAPYRGESGPLDSAPFPVPANQTSDGLYLTQSFAAAGSVAVNSDYNNPATPIGATEQVQFYLQPSFTREDASVGFLGTDVMTPDGFGVGAREGKLRVLLNSTVIRLIWSGNKCIGVEYTSGGQSFKVFAAKEVILSTGIRSPGMLQREGIGDATLLNSLGIPVRVDNPNVGNNMHNHPEWLVLVNAPNAAFAPFGTPFINTIETCAFLPTTIGGTTRSFEIVPIMFNGVPDTIFMATFYVTPESVGTANIQNRDPLKIELADPEYLTNPNDLTNIMAFFTQYFTNLNNYWAANQSPEATTWALASPTAATIADPVLLEQWLRTNLTEAYHWSCMCRMGTNITNSVVDSHCRVWGVDGLRVVDNQSCPVVEDGNTSSTAYLMGESVAEFILAGG